MGLLAIHGEIEVPAAPDVCLHTSVRYLAEALSKRFDNVRVDGAHIQASAGWKALVFRGPRTHPMLPFDRLRITIAAGVPARLRFETSIKMQVLLTAYLAVGPGLLASVGSGLATGLTIGDGFAAAVFALNLIVSWHRASRWLAKTWTEALSALPDAKASSPG